MICCPSGLLTLFNAVNKLIYIVSIVDLARRIVSELNKLLMNRTMASRAPNTKTVVDDATDDPDQCYLQKRPHDRGR